MLLKSFIPALFFLQVIPSFSHAQTFFCSAFSITNTFPDSTNPNGYLFSIQCVAGPNEFVSYPFLPVVMDCNGDTVATGNLFWFGQTGQSSQDYPVTLTGNGDISCYPLTANFIINYDPGFTDTCLLSYGTTGVPVQDDPPHGTHIYPNPVKSSINIYSNPVHSSETYIVYDKLGKTVTSGEITGEITTADFSDLETGLYLISIGENRKSTFKFIKD